MSLYLSTKGKAVKEAKELVEFFGYNGFTFQELADRLGIKKPSLYSHFESKEGLAKALLQDEAASFGEWTDSVQYLKPEAKIEAFFERIMEVVRKGKRVSTLSSFAFESGRLPTKVKNMWLKSFELEKAWLKKVIAAGQSDKTFRSDLAAKELTELIFSLSFGAQALTRIMDDPRCLKSVKHQALEILKV